MAPVRSRRVSRARYTSPMPPAPMAETTSYGPSFVPEAKGMCGGLYTMDRHVSQASDSCAEGRCELDEAGRGVFETQAMLPEISQEGANFCETRGHGANVPGVGLQTFFQFARADGGRAWGAGEWGA